MSQQIEFLVCTSYYSKAGELTFFVCVEDLQKILNDAPDDVVYPKHKMHTKSSFNQQ